MTFNESDLIAYQLHELSPRRTRALRRALDDDPELAAEAEAIAWTLRAFSNAPTPTVDDAVLDRNWQSLRPSLAVLTPAAPSFWRRPLTIGAGLALATASVIGIAFLTTQHIPVRPTTTATASAPATAMSTHSAAPTPDLSSQAGSHRFGRGVAPRPAVSPETNSNDFNALLPFDGRNIPPKAGVPASATTGSATNGSIATNSRPNTLTAATPGNALGVATAPATIAPPLQASITNSVPLQKSAQTLHTYSASTIVAPKPRATHEHEIDVSVGGFAALTSASNTTDNNYIAAVGSQPGTQTTTQTIDPAAGLLVAFHHQVRRYAGYQVAAGYSRQALNTTTTNSTGTQGGLLLANTYEVSAAYVVRGPHTHRISTHAAAGASALDFVPASSQSLTHHVLRPAGLFTVGLDYHIKRRWSLRAEYRALFFKSPNLQDNTTTLTGYTIASEPTISLNYRFDSLVRP